MGRLPTEMTLTTSAVVGSIRETVPSPAFATQTAPPPKAMPVGPVPVPKGMFDPEPEEASIRVTLSSASLATHTAPAPKATDRGRPPTVKGFTSLTVLGLTWESVLDPAFATHTQPAPKATPEGLFPTTPMSPGTFVDGST